MSENNLNILPESSNLFPQVPQNFATPPGLYVAATPIGCVADISVRVMTLFQKAGVILAENIGTSKKLLNILQINTQGRWIHFTEHQDPQIALEQYLLKPDIYLLVSEAGTSAINDPGVRLVGAFRKAQLPVYTLPGPSSVIAAWSVSGWEGNWLYLGFLPKKDKELELLIQNAQNFPSLGDKTATIFCALESPHRIEATLQAFAQYRPSQEVMILRELSKQHESYYCDTPQNLLNSTFLPDLKRGEIVFIWKKDQSEKSQLSEVPAAAEKINASTLKHIISILRNNDLKTKEKSKILAEMSGASSQEIYTWFNN